MPDSNSSTSPTNLTVGDNAVVILEDVFTAVVKAGKKFTVGVELKLKPLPPKLSAMKLASDEMN
jgi:hypothetical protein